MSKKLILATAAAAAAMTAPQAAHAVTITTTMNSTGAITNSSGVVIQNFNRTGNSIDTSFSNAGNPLDTVNLALAGVTATQSSTGFVRVRSATGNGSIEPTTSADPTNSEYLAIGGNGSYTLSFGGAGVQYLSFVVGSLDSFNSVRLSFSDSTSLLLTGQQINGTSTLTEGRVSYHMNGGASITSAVFSSTSGYFEIDDIAVAAPEPATWAMMLLGFGMIGSQLRRRNRKAAGKLALA